MKMLGSRQAGGSDAPRMAKAADGGVIEPPGQAVVATAAMAAALRWRRVLRRRRCAAGGEEAGRRWRHFGDLTTTPALSAARRRAFGAGQAPSDAPGRSPKRVWRAGIPTSGSSLPRRRRRSPASRRPAAPPSPASGKALGVSRNLDVTFEVSAGVAGGDAGQACRRRRAVPGQCSRPARREAGDELAFLHALASRRSSVRLKAPRGVTMRNNTCGERWSFPRAVGSGQEPAMVWRCGCVMGRHRRDRRGCSSSGFQPR